MMVMDIYTRNGKLIVTAKDKDDFVGTIMQIPFHRGKALQITLNELVNTELKINNCKLEGER